ncbi:MAG TPA: cyclic nucleotide-binding domain-containing protein, partial [Alcanivorax sp.]|nr:cyclic nucleotide-binding domain-containing protein [Alcanivorax sp.]
MKHAQWQESDHARVEALLSGVPFFNEVARDDADQRALLLARTEIIEAG